MEHVAVWIVLRRLSGSETNLRFDRSGVCALLHTSCGSSRGTEGYPISIVQELFWLPYAERRSQSNIRTPPAGAPFGRIGLPALASAAAARCTFDKASS